MLQETPVFEGVAGHLSSFTSLSEGSNWLKNEVHQSSDQSSAMQTLRGSIAILEHFTSDHVWEIPLVSIPNRPEDLDTSEFANFVMNQLVDVAWARDIPEETRALSRKALKAYFDLQSSDESLLELYGQQITDDTLVKTVATLFSRGERDRYEASLTPLKTVLDTERDVQQASDRVLRRLQWTAPSNDNIEETPEGVPAYTRLVDTIVPLLALSKYPEARRRAIAEEFVNRAFVNPESVIAQLPEITPEAIDYGARDALLRAKPGRNIGDILRDIPVDSHEFYDIGKMQARVLSLRGLLYRQEPLDRRTAFVHAELRRQLADAEADLLAAIRHNL